jgi:hypothetical protein
MRNDIFASFVAVLEIKHSCLIPAEEFAGIKLQADCDALQRQISHTMQIATMRFAGKLFAVQTPHRLTGCFHCCSHRHRAHQWKL